MPDLKISALPDVGTITGDEWLVLVQSGADKRIRFRDVKAGLPELVNVRLHGATGDGSTDDTDAIEAAMDLLDGVGGILYFPPGVYLVRLWENPDYAGFWHGVHTRSGVRMVGAGKVATEIQMIAGQALHASAHIVGCRNQAGPNFDIAVEQMTVNGNAANQTNDMMGVLITQTRGVTFTDLDVKNVHGSGNSPPAETFHVESSYCSDVSHTRCTAYSDDGGDTASGFSADVSTNVTYDQCHGRGMTFGHGFTHWHTSAVTYTGCTAQQNGDLGFNSELSRDVTYVGCVAGGKANDQAAAFPYSIDEDLGNVGSGFVCNATVNVKYVGCTGRGNNDNGLAVVPTGVNLPTGRVIGCTFTGNTNHGIYFGPADTIAPGFKVDKTTSVTGNGFDMNIGTTIGSVNVETLIGTQPITADNVARSNPYPFDLEVYVVAGTLNGVTINGAFITGNVRQFRVPAGGSYKLHYSGGNAPTDLIGFWS